jgi:hypothetical protein
LLTKLPASFIEVHISKTFFEVTQIDDDFLKKPAVEWPATQSFKEAVDMVSKLVCVNDCAERGVKLIEDFNLTTTDETQNQYIPQVVRPIVKPFTSVT